MQDPGEEPSHLEPAEHLRDALVHAEGRDRADVAVLVVRRRVAPQHPREVVGQVLGLPDRVLGVRRAERARVVQVRDRGTVAGRIRVGHDHAVGGHDLERREAGHPALLVERQVRAPEDRVGLDARGPHDRLGVELGPVGQHDVPVDARAEERRQVDVDVALAELVEGVLPELDADLGQDARRALHEHEPQLRLLDPAVVPDRRARHVLDLGDGLDPGEPAAHEREGEHPLAQVRVPRARGPVDPAEHLVADRDGLFDVLEADGDLGEPGDGQSAGDRAEADDQVVIGDPVRRALLGRHLDGALGVADLGDLALQHVDVLERPAQRCDDVARVDRPRRGLGQERRVGHVGPRVDDDDRRLALAEPPTQAVGRVQADAATAEDDDARHLAGLALRRGRGDRAARRRRGGGRVDDGVGC